MERSDMSIFYECLIAEQRKVEITIVYEEVKRH